MVDVPTVCLAVATLCIGVSTLAVMWSSGIHSVWSDRRTRLNRRELEIRALVEELQNPLGDTTSSIRNNNTVSLQIALSKLPWLKRRQNTLRNYFVAGLLRQDGKYHRRYTHAPLVIMPFFHDHDDRFDRCIRSTSVSQNQAVSPRMRISGRARWEDGSEGAYRFKHKFKLHYGEMSFGLCASPSEETAPGGDNVPIENTATIVSSYNTLSSAQTIHQANEKASIHTETSNTHRILKDSKSEIKRNPSQKFSSSQGDHPVVGEHGSYPSSHSSFPNPSPSCGFVLLVQDPIRLAMADYGKCLLPESHKSHTSLMCRIVHKHQMDIESWIKARGNVVFKSLLFHPAICQRGSLEKLLVLSQHSEVMSDSLPLSSTSSSFSSATSAPSTEIYPIPPSSLPAPPSSSTSSTSPSSSASSASRSSSSSSTFSDNSQESCEATLQQFTDALGNESQNVLLEYILDNIPHWFSMVGTHEDLANSLNLVQRVHRLPLHQCSDLGVDKSPTQRKNTEKQRPRSSSSSSKSSLPFQSESNPTSSTSPTSSSPLSPSSLSLRELLETHKDEVSLLRALSQYANRVERSEGIEVTKLDAPQQTGGVHSSDKLTTSHENISSQMSTFSKKDHSTQTKSSIATSDINLGGDSDGRYQINDEYINLEDDVDIVDVDEFSSDMEDLSVISNDHSMSNKVNDNDDEDDEDFKEGDDLKSQEVKNSTPNDVKLTREIISDHILSFQSRRVETNTPWDTLYERLAKSDVVRKALAMDLQIYKHVKKLHNLQRLLAYNSIHQL